MQDGFKVGDFLRGEHYSEGSTFAGVLISEDTEDNTLCLLIDSGRPDRANPFDFEYIKAPASAEYPGRPEHLSKPPGALAALFGQTDHVFVVGVEDGHMFELYASPQAVEAAHSDIEDLRTKIMEAVADPDEPIRLDDTHHLSFRVIQGAT